MTDQALQVPKKADPGFSLAEMKRFVAGHFDDFVNKKHSDAALRNFSPDFLDHDEAGGPAVGPEAAKSMMERAYKMWPNLRVEILDIVAEGDRVVVRNRWSGTHQADGTPFEFHGFVMWRFANRMIVERWATITAPTEARISGGGKSYDP